MKFSLCCRAAVHTVNERKMLERAGFTLCVSKSLGKTWFEARESTIEIELDTLWDLIDFQRDVLEDTPIRISGSTITIYSIGRFQ